MGDWAAGGGGCPILSLLCVPGRDAATGVTWAHEPRSSLPRNAARWRGPPRSPCRFSRAPPSWCRWPPAAPSTCPDKTVEELLEFAAASDVDALSGTIEQTSELGLPDLGGLMGSGRRAARRTDSPAAGIDDFIALATGTHTANVFLDGERARLQVLDPLAERNVYIDGEADQAWFVDSETQTATRFTPPSDAELEQYRSELGPMEDDAAEGRRRRFRRPIRCSTTRSPGSTRPPR